MDINSLLTSQIPIASVKGLDNALNLKIGQQLDVTTISQDITAAKNTITLSLGNKDIIVQSNQPVTLNSGQNLKIQVVQIAPVIAFKIISTLPDLSIQTANLRLRLVATATDGLTNPSGKDAMPATQTNSANVAIINKLARSVISTGNPFMGVKIVNVSGNTIQFQVLNRSSPSAVPETGTQQTGLITVERSQLANAPSTLKVGQNLNLELIKASARPEFKIVYDYPPVSEAKIADFIKQFLPRHEAAPIFLNQLIKDLPQLIKNETVPQSLKEIATQIIRNLPPKEQLISGSGLKQALVNSGLFLEAKLPAQAALIEALPLLIKNPSLPLSLQRIATEILHNLTQQEPLPNSAASSSKPFSEAELIALKLTLEQQILATKTTDLESADFKANVLKLIGALKQELSTATVQPANQIDVDLLQNLQNKTENTLAKIVLDQLMSLPKEDHPKQLWIIDIPFINRGQAESVRVEVQQHKATAQQPGSIDWSVNMTLTPPQLGTLQCLVSCRNEIINTFFKSPSLQTTELIKNNLDYLKNQLEDSGLKTGQMDAHEDAQTKPSSLQLPGKRLFDDKA